MPPHGYIIAFGGSYNTNLWLRYTKKYYIIYTVGRGAEGGGGYLSNRPESTMATDFYPIFLSPKYRNAYQLPARVSI